MNEKTFSCAPRLFEPGTFTVILITPKKLPSEESSSEMTIPICMNDVSPAPKEKLVVESTSQLVAETFTVVPAGRGPLK